VSTIPTSSEITITMISGAWPEPRIQLTFTWFRLSSANTMKIAVTTSTAPPRASSLLSRLAPPAAFR